MFISPNNNNNRLQNKRGARIIEYVRDSLPENEWNNNWRYYQIQNVKKNSAQTIKMRG